MLARLCNRGETPCRTNVISLKFVQSVGLGTKGKLIGAKPPLRPKHVWSIRIMLQGESRKRDLALFNLAIDSKLRGCDVVSARVEDVAPRDLTVDRASIRQKKTGHPVKFEIMEHTLQPSTTI